MRYRGRILCALMLAVLAGCSSASDLQSTYDKCVSTFGENLAPANEGLGLGPPEDYLAIEDNTLSVTTPADREPGVGIIGANEAVMCVMEQLDAPDEVRHQAAAGSEDGTGSWSDYTATWAHPDALTIELHVTQK